MKTSFFIFLTIGSCFINGCSTKTTISPPAARYSELPTTAVGLPTAAELQAKRDRENYKVTDADGSDDVFLWTDDYRTYYLWKGPLERVRLSGGLKDRMLRDHKVAFVVNPSIGPVFVKGEEPKDFRQAVEQTLKDTGFAHVHFYTLRDLLNVP